MRLYLLFILLFDICLVFERLHTLSETAFYVGPTEALLLLRRKAKNRKKRAKQKRKQKEKILQQQTQIQAQTQTQTQTQTKESVEDANGVEGVESSPYESVFDKEYHSDPAFPPVFAMYIFFLKVTYSWICF